MQFLTLSRRRTDRFTEADFALHLEAEIRQARLLYAEGFLRQIWHRDDVPGACMLVEADSAEQVHEKLGTLPLVGAGMLDVTIVPLRPYAGFAPPGNGGRCAPQETARPRLVERPRWRDAVVDQESSRDK